MHFMMMELHVTVGELKIKMVHALFLKINFFVRILHAY